MDLQSLTFIMFKENRAEHRQKQMKTTEVSYSASGGHQVSPGGLNMDFAAGLLLPMLLAPMGNHYCAGVIMESVMSE